jgi:hypothetical protein
MILQSPTISGSLTVSGSINLNGQPLTVSLVPIFESVSPVNVNSTASLQVIQITGQNFDGTVIGYLKDNNGTRKDPTTSVRNSDVLLTLTYSGSDRITSANEPYDVYILNGNGENTFEENLINVDASPVWQTTAGKVGEIYANTYLTASINILATDPDSNDTLTYAISGGALPAGMTLITSSGELSGSTQIPLDTGSYNASGVNYNFTSTVTDGISTAVRSFYITKKWADGSTPELAANNAIDLVNLGMNTNGYYWITPDGVNNHYVYCDLNTEGGGWMLMQRLKNDGQFINNGDFGLQTVDGNAGVPKIDHSNSSGFGTTKFNRFTTATGTKYLRIIPTNKSISGYDGMYFYFGTDTTKVWPGGSSLEASNRSTLVGSSTTSWVATIYPTLANAIAGTAGETGTYSSANHYYPTTYPNAQLFYRGSGNGVRWADNWNSTNPYTDNGEGTVWVRIT